MDNYELEKMARFFLAKIFDNIPYVTTRFATDDELDDNLGETKYTEGTGYMLEKDKLKDMPEYSAMGEVIAPGIVAECRYEPSFMDAENNPQIEILISSSLKDDLDTLTGILLHELCHYWCWYRGYDHHDGDSQFERKLHELKLPSNSDYKYDRELGKYVVKFDFSRMKSYVNM